jgi:hypothetical protein
MHAYVYNHHHASWRADLNLLIDLYVDGATYMIWPYAVCAHLIYISFGKY